MNLKTVKQLSCACCVDSHTLVNTSVRDLSTLNLQNLPSIQKSSAPSTSKWPIVFVPRDSCIMKGKMEKMLKVLTLQTRGPNRLQTFL